MARPKTRTLLYGAYGYTGRLAATLAAAKRLQLVLAGRREEPLRQLGQRLTLPTRAVGLDDTTRLEEALSDIGCVVHMAGPFATTSTPMLNACLATGTHYVDITGEIEVFEAIWSRDKEIRGAGISVVPGAGFDVVPTDCLAAYTTTKLEEPRWLVMALRGLDGASQGTLRTAIRQISKPVLCRRQGVIVALADRAPRMVNFGDGDEPCLPISWGDVATAFHSTGIENITVYFRRTRLLHAATAAGPLFSRLLQSQTGQKALAAMIRRLPEGPNESERLKHRSTIRAEVADDSGHTFAALLHTPDPYDFTANSALDIAARLNVSTPFGLATPSQAFGADFVLSLPGCSRVDVSPETTAPGLAGGSRRRGVKARARS